jgi:hypothetical protein
MKLTPKKWEEFQHYKDRSPSWIKLHKAILDDYDFACLPVASRALAPMLWLLASEYPNGVIDASLEKLAFRFRLTPGEMGEALNPLIEAGFFTVEQAASTPLADRKPDASLEKRREEVEKEKKNVAKRVRDACSPEFEDFWKKYPTTPVMSKKQAWAEWQKLTEPDQSAALAAVAPFKEWLAKQKDHPVVHACRFLSQRRFEGFKPSLEVVASTVFVPGDSDAFAAWERHMGRKFPRDRNGGWRFASEYPPGHERGATTIGMQGDTCQVI